MNLFWLKGLYEIVHDCSWSWRRNQRYLYPGKQLKKVSNTYPILLHTRLNVRLFIYHLKILVIHEGNTKQISTMTVTLYLIKLIDVRKTTNEYGILYKRTWDFI